MQFVHFPLVSKTCIDVFNYPCLQLSDDQLLGIFWQQVLLFWSLQAWSACSSSTWAACIDVRPEAYPIKFPDVCLHIKSNERQKGVCVLLTYL